MREISNHFLVIPQELICDAVKMGESVGVPFGSKEYICPSPVVFSQTPSDGEAGTTYMQTFRAVTTDPESIMHNGARAYIGVMFTDGSVEVIGSGYDLPAITVTPYQGVLVVEVSFTSLHPMVL